MAGHDGSTRGRAPSSQRRVGYGRAGHTVYAPTLEGCGERAPLLRPGITVGTQAQEIAQLLFYEDLQDVVLVGTSAGGMVLCKAAELARERLAHLVFVDALALLPG